MDGELTAPVRQEAARFSGSRIRSLDGLRALGVSAVVCFHVFGEDLGGGRLGVDVFFALSGFLITTIIHREYAATGGFRFARFYSRRLFRLYPALLVTVLLTLPVYRYMSDAGTLGAWVRSAGTAATYTMNLGIVGDVVSPTVALSPTWSLAQEEQFYLLWPILLVLLLRLRGGLVTAMLGALACVAASWCFLLAVFPRGEFHPETRSGAMMIGCAAALAVLKWGLPSRRLANGVLWIAGPAVVACIAAASLAGAEYRPEFVPVVSLLVAALTPCLLAAADHRVARALSHPVASWLGLRSYSIYLLHVPVLATVAGTTGWSTASAALVGVPATLLLAEAMYRSVELPGLRLRERRAGTR